MKPNTCLRLYDIDKRLIQKVYASNRATQYGVRLITRAFPSSIGNPLQPSVGLIDQVGFVELDFGTPPNDRLGSHPGWDELFGYTDAPTRPTFSYTDPPVATTRGFELVMTEDDRPEFIFTENGTLRGVFIVLSRVGGIDPIEIFSMINFGSSNVLLVAPGQTLTVEYTVTMEIAPDFFAG